jgi:flagellar biosynthetic protein FliR
MEMLVLAVSLLLARVGAFVTVLPAFGGPGLPRMVKVGLTFALTFFWSGSWEALLGHDLLGKPLPISWVYFFILLGREIILGGALGFALGLFLVPARIAGDYIGQEMGLTLGNISDPSFQASGTAMGQIFEMLGALIFLGLDGHHIFLVVLQGTFARWPLGASAWTLPVAHMIDGAAAAHEWGLLLAAPVGLCLLVTSITLALMARAAPQMNLIAVGFGLRVVVGLVTAILFLPSLGASMVSIFGRVAEWINGL